MTSRLARPVLLPILAGLLLAGCLSSSSQDGSLGVVKGSAENGFFGYAWNYDGKGVESSPGSFARWSWDPGTRRLDFSANFSLGKSEAMNVALRDFRPVQASGPVRLRGDESDGAASFPGVNATVAGWANASVSRPGGGAGRRYSEVPAFFMALPTGFRDDGNQAILNAHRNGIFRPKEPFDWFGAAGDAEVHLLLYDPARTYAGPRREVLNATDAVSAPGYTRTFPLGPVPLGENVTFRAWVRASYATLYDASFSFDLQDGKGTRKASIQVSGITDASVSRSVSAVVDTFRPLQVKVNGRCASCMFGVSVVLEDDERLSSDLWWE